ncbi:MAG: hypothetical protein GXY20_11140 [Clostridiales bacterium]|nr:hypothetical protein [Clostridiales bacterium]
MKKRLLTYRKKIDALLLSGNCDWEALIKEHLTQISFFQHERLIHLIVTALFAILEVMSVMMIMISPATTTIIFSAAIAVLLIPYLLHYFTLENEVQKLYVQYDKMREACVNNNPPLNSTDEQ